MHYIIEVAPRIRQSQSDAELGPRKCRLRLLTNFLIRRQILAKFSEVKNIYERAHALKFKIFPFKIVVVFIVKKL